MSTTLAAPRTLTDAQIREYHANGFVVVQGLYEPEECVEYKRVVREMLADEFEKITSGVRVWMAPTIHPTILKLMVEPNITAMLNQVVGPDLEFLSAKAVFKTANVKFGSPWHQDWFYWGGPTKVSVWIALDDATPENGCLRFAEGTHTKVLPKSRGEGNAFTEQFGEETVAEYKKVDIRVKRGDAVIFHDLAAHASYENKLGTDRWSFISTYRSGAVLDDAKVWEKGLVVSGRSVNANFPRPF